MCVCLCPQAIMCRSAHVVWSCTLKVITTVCPFHGDGNPWYQYRAILNIDLCIYLTISAHLKKVVVVHSHMHVSTWGSFWMLVRIQLFDNDDFALFHCVYVCVCLCVCVCVCERDRETEEGKSTEEHKSTSPLNNSTFLLSNMYLISLSGWQQIVETNPSLPRDLNLGLVYRNMSWMQIILHMYVCMYVYIYIYIYICIYIYISYECMRL